MSVELLQGTVMWYNPRRAYGFIRIADGRECFVHRSALAEGRIWLIAGQAVRLRIIDGRNGPEAAEVVVARDVPVPACQRHAYRAEARRHDYARRTGQDPRHVAPPRRDAAPGPIRPTRRTNTGQTERGESHGKM